MAELWGYGITDTHKVYDAEGLALYFKSYLSDIEYTDEPVVEGLADEPKNVVEKNVNGWNKKFIKGERFKLSHLSRTF